MTPRSIRHLVMAFLLVLPAVEAQGQGEYIRQPPTSSDLYVHEGLQKTLVVQIVNLTPYDIQLKDTNLGSIPSLSASSVSAADEDEMIDRSRNTKKSFMFAPVGLPRLIPALPPQSFDPDSGYYNTESRSYSMVFSWDDRGGYVEDSWVKWTVQGVEYSKVIDGVLVPQDPVDVDVGLWMNRPKPEKESLKSGDFFLVSKAVFAAFHTFALVVEWENPVAWIEEFVALSELGIGVAEFEEENAEADDGYQMYLASYVVPAATSSCILHPTCYPQVWSSNPSIGATDGVASFWAGSETGYMAGAAEAALVVSTHLLRGHSAPKCQGYRDPYQCTLGSLPILMITVWRAEDWTANYAGAILHSDEFFAAGLPPIELENARHFLLQAGAGQILAHLQHWGHRPVLLTLASVVRELQPEQQQVLREMLRSAGSDRRPTKEEREVVRVITRALQDRLRRD